MNSGIRNVIWIQCIVKVLIIKLQSANTAETRQYKKASKALLVLIPLLGITYLVVWIGPASGVSSQLFDVLRAFLISTQVVCHFSIFCKMKLFFSDNIWKTFFPISFKIRYFIGQSNNPKKFGIRLQGFSVSLLYCFLNSEVKQALYHRLSIWREKRNIGNDTQMDYRKHRNGLSKEYSSPRSRTESIR